MGPRLGPTRTFPQPGYFRQSVDRRRVGSRLRGSGRSHDNWFRPSRDARQRARGKKASASPARRAEVQVEQRRLQDLHPLAVGSGQSKGVLSEQELRHHANLEPALHVRNGLRSLGAATKYKKRCTLVPRKGAPHKSEAPSKGSLLGKAIKPRGRCIPTQLGMKPLVAPWSGAPVSSSLSWIGACGRSSLGSQCRSRKPFLLPRRPRIGPTNCHLACSREWATDF